ncbi:hypothetical protein M1L58_13265, partial [Gordonia sp. C13]|nr:hypothetical protein [Gordonia sp. C13]
DRCKARTAPTSCPWSTSNRGAGQITGDNSDPINRLVWGLSDWRGPQVHGKPRRVIGYLNPHDAHFWPTRPPIGFVVPSYGSRPRFTADTRDLAAQMIAHQYTDGQGYGTASPRATARSAAT